MPLRDRDQDGSTTENVPHLVHSDGTVEELNVHLKHADGSREVIVDVVAPAAPADLQAQSVGETSVDLTWNPSDDFGGSGLDHYDVYVDGTLDHEVLAGVTSSTVEGLESDVTYDFHVTAVDRAGNESPASNTLTVTTATPTRSPYDGVTRELPTRVEAQHFDEGGQDVAYWDTDPTANTGGAFRTDEGVDIEETGDVSGTYNVGWIEDGEWLEYTVDTVAGTYDVDLRVANPGGNDSVTVSLDGTVLGTVEVPATGDWQNWTTVTIPAVSLSDGTGRRLRLEFAVGDSQAFNVNWVEFREAADTTAPTAPSDLTVASLTDTTAELTWTASEDSGGSGLDHYDVYVDGALDQQVPAGTTSTTVDGLSADTTYESSVVAVDGAGNESDPSTTVTYTTATGQSDGQSPYGGANRGLPGRVQAQHFDEGGQDVAYWDTDPTANSGGAFRTDEGVDIQATEDVSGTYNVGWIEDGEWLEYTVDTTAGTYDVNVRVSNPGGVDSIAVVLDGTTVGTAEVPETGGWQNWTTVTVPDVSLGDGTGRTLRLEFSVGTSEAFNLNWVEFADTSGSSDTSVTVTGDQQVWHRTSLELDGPETGETDSVNPFLDRRFAVRFTKPSGETMTVPGHFAADGDAANTGASAGSVWRCHLMADESGTWEYETIFEEGTEAAVNPGSGTTNTTYDGITGSFTVDPTDKATPDARGSGLLVNPGGHHFQFRGDGEYYLKNGANSPENFLGYYGFDNTYSQGGDSPPTSSGVHEYGPHESDFTSGDPTWRDGNGKGIVGAINYLSGEGVNQHYFLTYNVDGGDGADTWPWVGDGSDKRRYDCSKLDQWEVVFEHMTRQGVALHVVTQERENDGVIDGGGLGTTRELYYRELVSRFAHHPALFWNLGEEFSQGASTAAAFAASLRDLDPYGHPVGVHNWPSEIGDLWGPLTGNEDFDFGPMQDPENDHDANPNVKNWREKTAADGNPWGVTGSELGHHSVGTPCDGETVDGVDQSDVRRISLWGSLCAGAAGCEWYFGGDTCASDRKLEDYRTRDNWWDFSRYATTFFRDNVPFWEMRPDDSRLDVPGHGYVHPDGTHYVFYLDDGGDATVDVASRTFQLSWYDPRTGTVEASETINGGSGTALGTPPVSGDVVALLVAQ